MTTRRTTAVTGAGGGIGFALACELAGRGHHVLALDLHDAMAPALLEATAHAPGAVTFQKVDIAAPGDFAFPDDLSILINNAGIRGSYLSIEDTPAADWRRVFDVNFFGTVEMVQRATPVLRSNGGGVICNVTSASLLRPIPFLASYRASKAATSALNESLRLELAPFGIAVLEAMPGPTSTGLATDSMTHRLVDAADYPAYAPMAHRLQELHQELPPAVDARVAANAIADAVEAADGPMRFGTSPASVATLERWRTTTDEELSLTALAAHGLAR